MTQGISVFTRCAALAAMAGIAIAGCDSSSSPTTVPVDTLATIGPGNATILQNKTFTFASGEVFAAALAGQSTTLTLTNIAAGGTGSFTLQSAVGTAQGTSRAGSILLDVVSSTISGITAGDTLTFDPATATIDAEAVPVGGTGSGTLTLSLTNSATATAGSSTPTTATIGVGEDGSVSVDGEDSGETVPTGSTGSSGG